jgi:hypothetical protein
MPVDERIRVKEHFFTNMELNTDFLLCFVHKRDCSFAEGLMLDFVTDLDIRHFDFFFRLLNGNLNCGGCTDGFSELVSFSLTKTGCNYDIAGTDNGAVSRYLTNLAQLRILSEKNFVDLCESGIVFGKMKVSQKVSKKLAPQMA